MPAKAPSIAAIARMLDRIADLLEAKEESPFRVRSYRNAAVSIRASKKPLSTMARKQGADTLTAIPGVGEKLAGLIAEYIASGKVELLTDLEKEVPQEKVHPKHSAEQGLSVPLPLVLAIDNEYRARAAAGKLKKIAPRQHNPERKAWLPIMVVEREGYRFTVMYSNTARAHELGKTDDWTVVYFEKGKGENQCTVVTETRGRLKGKRVVRGREAECQAHYGTT
jgi:DNA polymerase (family 10)